MEEYIPAMRNNCFSQVAIIGLLSCESERITGKHKSIRTVTTQNSGIRLLRKSNQHDFMIPGVSQGRANTVDDANRCSYNNWSVPIHLFLMVAEKVV